MLKTNTVVVADVDVITVPPALLDVDAIKRDAINAYNCLVRSLGKGYRSDYEHILNLISFVDLVEAEYRPINELDARKIYEYLRNNG